VLYLGASGAPEHTRHDHHCCHEALCRRELCWGRRDSSPFAPPSVILELRLDSGFAANVCHPCRRLLGSDDTAAATGAGPAHLRAAAVCSPGVGTFSGPYFQLMHTICVFVILQYSNRTGRPLPFPTAGPRQQEPPTIFALGGSRPSVFQFPVADIPSSSTQPMFQPTFDTTTEEQLVWDQMEFGDVLTTLDASQQPEEVGPSQLTHAPVWTQPTQPAAGGGTPAGRGTPNAVGSSQAAMATPSPDQLGLWVVRAPDPWTYDRD
jgi:hypothetical protein